MQKAAKARKRSVRDMVITSLMIAIGLILPYVTAHGIGVPGNILLPMHIPVLLCGLLCGPWYGAASGIIIPILSSILTGMPPVFPILPMMLVQLLAMGLVSGLLHRRLTFCNTLVNIILSIAAAIVAGLLAYAAIFNILILAGNESMGTFSIIATVTRGLPGIAIQLILIPILVSRLQKSRMAEHKGYAPGERVIAEAKDIIRRGESTCIVIRHGKIIHKAEGRGVSPLLHLYDNEPDKLAGAMVVDIIIGKAAAMILVLGGATQVYGETMSAAGLAYLQTHGVHAEYRRCVDVIHNRTQTGICPIEQAVLECEDAEQGVESLIRTIESLMQAS